MLSVKDINIFYGKLHILWDLSLEVGRESVGLFGPNGAGKTTLINAVLGLVRPVSGEIQFDGEVPSPPGDLPEGPPRDLRGSPGAGALSGDDRHGKSAVRGGLYSRSQREGPGEPGFRLWDLPCRSRSG